MKYLLAYFIIPPNNTDSVFRIYEMSSRRCIINKVMKEYPFFNLFYWKN